MIGQLLLLLVSLLTVPATQPASAPTREVARYRLLVWGDCRPWTTSGTAVSTGFRAICRAMPARGARHAVALGDFVTPASSDSTATIDAKYDAFHATYGRVAVPTDYVAGNHDVATSTARAVYYRRVHPAPTYYATADGPFHVIVLSTVEPGYVKRIGYYGVGDSRNSPQADWLVRRLRAITNKRAWIVVALHHPLLDPETDDPFATSARTERNALVRLFHDYGVDLVLQGDAHYYRRHLRPDGASYVTEGMAGAPPVAANSIPIDSRDAKTLGSSTSAPKYGYCTVTRNRTGAVVGRMFWEWASDGWPRHAGDVWTQHQVSRIAP